MSRGFYPHLAIEGMRKNKRLYLPYLLTAAGMVMMQYIVTFLGVSETILSMPGGMTTSVMMRFGSFVIAFFALIFLFYTNAFLIRRRKKEFGLYSVLGMNRKNIGRILFFEALFSYGLSVIFGLIGGIAFSKLAELGLVNVVGAAPDGIFMVSVPSLLMTAGLFAVIFLLLYLNALRQVYFSSAVGLMGSESAGEKPPRANPLLGILGVLALIAAYGIAATVQSPITAMGLFFVAVLLVIAGTYLLMIAGSVLLCGILKRKKHYYYHPKHFVSVSSMAYRMKRNGAGLASVCILATMVLVMISSTSSLYFGAEDSLRMRYPNDVRFEFHLRDRDAMADENIRSIQGLFSDAIRESGFHPTETKTWRSASMTGLLHGNVVETDPERVNEFSVDAVNSICIFRFLSLRDYSLATGTSAALQPGEALLFSDRCRVAEETLRFAGGGEVRLVSSAESEDRQLLFGGESSAYVTPMIVLVLPDFSDLTELTGQTGTRDGGQMSYRWILAMETESSFEEQEALYASVSDRFSTSDVEKYGINGYLMESQEENRVDFYATYGGFFFLGIFLSIVFLVATVLMIYYKQISEGYEDAARFGIMRKVGMTGKEIRSSINSQLLTVFFLPLLLAGIHLAFAFPMIRKILQLFNLSNIGLFGITTIVSFLIFAVFYLLVYRLTSNAYYRIVSGADREME